MHIWGRERLPGFPGSCMEGLDSQKNQHFRKSPVKNLHAQERKAATIETLVSENENKCILPLSLMVSFH